MSRFLLLALPSFLVSACAAGPVPPAPQPPAPLPAASVLTTAAPQPTVTTRRTLIMETRPSGTSVVTRMPDGAYAVSFDMKWNGRGPHTDATLHLAPDGTIASYEAHGHHMMGTAFTETFTVEGGQARWKSPEESGDKALTTSGFFVPNAELPEAIGWLAQALLKAGGSLALLPNGQAHLEKTGEALVQAGGQQKHLTSYAITGLNLTPIDVWMEDDQWFGLLDPSFSLVPEGWETTVGALLEKQKKIDRERDQRIAERIAHPPPPAGLALLHARVLDVVRGAWVDDQTVIVVGGSIQVVGPFKTTAVPAGAESMDLGGKALLPGLWDMHTHLEPASGVLDIASGVTTVRDVGNEPDQLDDYKKRFDDRSAVGPHVLRAGFIEGRGERAASSTITAETADEARAAVAFYAGRGYEMVKIYSSVKPELVPIIAKEAHARGMMVTGHIPAHMLAREAVEAGYDGIEHVNMLFLNFFADHDTDTRTPLRFSLVGDKAGDFDLKSKPAQDFFALLRRHHTVVAPTFDAFEGLYVGQPGKVVPGLEWLVGRLPVNVRRGFLTGGLPLAGKEEAYRRSYDKMLQMGRALKDANVTLVAGTDSLAGLMLDHELELFVRSGLSPAEAIRDATIVPARVMKLDKKTGSIAVGKAADLIVVDGDPLARISDVSHVVTTLRSGVAYPSKALFDAVGVSYWQ